MAIFCSAGPATIAALMMVDRLGADRPSPATPAVTRSFQKNPDIGTIAARCERAVVTAYRDLHHYGMDEGVAFAACTTLYRIHHPETDTSTADTLVAGWLDFHFGGARRPIDGCVCD